MESRAGAGQGQQSGLGMPHKVSGLWCPYPLNAKCGHIISTPLPVSGLKATQHNGNSMALANLSFKF